MHITTFQEKTKSGKPIPGQYGWSAHNRGEITASGRGFRDNTDAARAGMQCVKAFIGPYKRRMLKAIGDSITQLGDLAFKVKTLPDGTKHITWK